MSALVPRGRGQRFIGSGEELEGCPQRGARDVRQALGPAQGPKNRSPLETNRVFWGEGCKLSRGQAPFVRYKLEWRSLSPSISQSEGGRQVAKKEGALSAKVQPTFEAAG